MSNPSVQYLINTVKKPHRSNTYIDERKQNETELQAPVNNVRPPIWLSTEAKRIFIKTVDELKIVKLVTNLDVNTLAVYCDNVAKYSDLEKNIKTINKSYKDFCKMCDDPLMILDKTSEISKLTNNIIGSQLKLGDAIRKYAVEFGLTPQSRAKLAIPRKDKKEKSEEEEMFARV